MLVSPPGLLPIEGEHGKKEMKIKISCQILFILGTINNYFISIINSILYCFCKV